MTFKGQIKYNWTFNGLYLLNGAFYDKSLHATQIVSHIYGLSVDLMIFDLGWLWHWITFKCQINVFEWLVGYISWIVHVIIGICVNNEQIWLPGIYGLSDLEQYLNRLQLDPISRLVNVSHEMVQIMATYDFPSAKQVILSNVWTDFNLTQFLFWSTFDRIGTYNDHIWHDFLWAKQMILSNVWTDFNLIIFTFGQLFSLIGTYDDHIWLATD